MNVGATLKWVDGRTYEVRGIVDERAIMRAHCDGDRFDYTNLPVAYITAQHGWEVVEEGVVDGVGLIAAERARQTSVEGWTPEHDDGHSTGELAIAAACYAAEGLDSRDGEPVSVVTHEMGSVVTRDAWPWSEGWDKRKKHSRIRQLAIAGALCAAEIDRLVRAGRG